MRHRQVPGRSHFGSTGRHRPPGGQNIACRVDVTVQHHQTSLAAEHPLTQRQHRLDPPACRAGLAGGQPAIHHDHLTPIPSRLVLQQRPELRPGRIGNRPGQRPVRHHVPHRQVLNHDRLVLANESSRHLVQHVPSPVSDASMDPSHLHSGLLPVAGCLLLTSQAPLCLGQSNAFPPLLPRIGDLALRIGQTRNWTGQGQQTGDPDIDTHLRPAGWQVFGGGLDQDRAVPATGRIPRHGHRGRVAAFGQRTRPPNVQRLSHLRQGQSSIAETEPRAGALRRRPGLLARLEAGAPGAVVEETRECRLEVPQALLQRHTGHLVQECQVLGAFPAGQQRRGLGVADAALLLVPCCGPGFQRLVVHQSYAAEGPRQVGGLSWSGIEAVPECPLHPRLRHDPQSIDFTDKIRTHVRVKLVVVATHHYGSVPPRPEGRGVHRLEFR
jgi:hypothetical protein